MKLHEVRQLHFTADVKGGETTRWTLPEGIVVQPYGMRVADIERDVPYLMWHEITVAALIPPTAVLWTLSTKKSGRAVFVDLGGQARLGGYEHGPTGNTQLEVGLAAGVGRTFRVDVATEVIPGRNDSALQHFVRTHPFDEVRRIYLTVHYDMAYRAEVVTGDAHSMHRSEEAARAAFRREPKIVRIVRADGFVVATRGG